MTAERILILVLGILLATALVSTSLTNNPSSTPAISTPVQQPTSFFYTFNTPGTLQEAGSMDDSTSPYFWLNSGGELIITDSVGETMTNAAPLNNVWRILYGGSNPVDTDGGYYPQDLFRLVTKSQWDNVEEEARFFIQHDHFSSSFNRNTSNGLLLMSRYAMDGQTLYYAGVRVDGTAVIKKKIDGIYYTMAQEKVFPGTYNGWQDNVNLIPHWQWLTLRSDTTTNSDGSVTVALYMQLPSGQGTWTKLLEATDSGQYGGTAPIVGPGYAGIRTDFMDVHFDNYRISAL